MSAPEAAPQSAGDNPPGPKISMITVVLNGGGSLERCLQSVVSQTYPHVEHIVADGGSTDGTLDILRRHENHLACWTSEPDNGIYDAMNKAVQRATGDWVCFLGSDDMLLDSLHQAAEHLKDPHTVYYGDVYMPRRRRLYAGRFGPWKLARTNICQQAVFYPRALLARRQFSLKYPLQADWEFLMQCHSDPDVSLHYIPVLVAVFNDSDGLSSRNPDTAFNNDYLRLVKTHFSRHVYLWRAAIAWAGRCARKLHLKR